MNKKICMELCNKKPCEKYPCEDVVACRGYKGEPVYKVEVCESCGSTFGTCKENSPYLCQSCFEEAREEYNYQLSQEHRR